MSKKKNIEKELVTEPVAENISVSDTEVDAPGKLNMDSLKEMKISVTKKLAEQQLLISEAINKYEDVLSIEPELTSELSGLSGTINDMLKHVNTVSIKHKDLSGEISDIDDQMLYIEVAAEYMNVEETVAAIGSTAYIDLLTKLPLAKEKLDNEAKKGE